MKASRQVQLFEAKSVQILHIVRPIKHMHKKASAAHHNGYYTPKFSLDLVRSSAALAEVCSLQVLLVYRSKCEPILLHSTHKELAVAKRLHLLIKSARQTFINESGSEKSKLADLGRFTWTSFSCTWERPERAERGKRREKKTKRCQKLKVGREDQILVAFSVLQS